MMIQRQANPLARITRQPNPSCLGKTCLKWEANGELSALDMQQVWDRLKAGWSDPGPDSKKPRQGGALNSGSGET